MKKYLIASCVSVLALSGCKSTIEGLLTSGAEKAQEQVFAMQHQEEFTLKATAEFKEKGYAVCLTNGEAIASIDELNEHGSAIGTSVNGVVTTRVKNGYLIVRTPQSETHVKFEPDANAYSGGSYVEVRETDVYLWGIRHPIDCITQKVERDLADMEYGANKFDQPVKASKIKTLVNEQMEILGRDKVYELEVHSERSNL
jgi:hypothetical protein